MATSKPATPVTAAMNDAVHAALPFDDTRDFDDVARGLIAELPDGGRITNDEGRVVWDLSKFSYVLDAEAPDTVNPSLWRQTQLIATGGLFEVCEGVYQIRSADLSNMDVIEGATGIIIVDPLISAETARFSLDLYYAHRPFKPVVAVIYTHSHVDHFGGVRGVIDEADVAAGRVQVIAPVGFTEAAVAENVLAGTAMGRRASYMYGNLIEPGPTGMISPGLGLATSSGRITMIRPTVEVTEDVEEMVIDGVRFTFMLAPDTEAPSEMLFHLPDHRALCSAEDATHNLHNLYTLRGAKTRDAKAWAHYLNKALDLFGDDSDVVFAQHHWPTWGAERVRGFLEAQRDAYKFLHDQTLRLANSGKTMNEISNELDWPESLGQHWSTRGYYGSVSHNVRAVYNLYLGYFDANPAHLDPYPPSETGTRYVEFMGGADAVLEKARASFEAGDYRWVAEVVNHVVFADPTNVAARELCADALEQLGYQSENGVWRNFYLSGALELRDGVSVIEGPAPNSADIIAAMPLGMIFDFLGVRLNADRAVGVSLLINIEITDEASWVLQVRNSVLNAFEGRQDSDAAVTISTTGATFRAGLVAPGGFQGGLADGSISIEGDAGALLGLFGLLDSFDRSFAIVEP
ncbi:MAG: alkyl sulfatase dimerization domain-containing protein [Actinomycetes bacterium]